MSNEYFSPSGDDDFLERKIDGKKCVVYSNWIILESCCDKHDKNNNTHTVTTTSTKMMMTTSTTRQQDGKTNRNNNKKCNLFDFFGKPGDDLKSINKTIYYSIHLLVDVVLLLFTLMYNKSFSFFLEKIRCKWNCKNMFTHAKHNHWTSAVPRNLRYFLLWFNFYSQLLISGIYLRQE